MTTQQKIVVNYNNDETAVVPITSGTDATGKPIPYNLTGAQIDFLIKPSSLTPDSDPSVIRLSTLTGEITVPSPTSGVCNVAISKSRLQTPGALFWRIDVVLAGTRNTAGYGVFDVAAM